MEKKYSFLVTTISDCSLFERTKPLTIEEAKFIKTILENPIISKDDGKWVTRTSINLDDKLDVDDDGNIIIPDGMVLNESLHLTKRYDNHGKEEMSDAKATKLDERGQPIKSYKRPYKKAYISNKW